MNVGHTLPDPLNTVRTQYGGTRSCSVARAPGGTPDSMSGSSTDPQISYLKKHHPPAPVSLPFLTSFLIYSAGLGLVASATFSDLSEASALG